MWDSNNPLSYIGKTIVGISGTRLSEQRNEIYRLLLIMVSIFQY